jgi:DNA modification methylase
VSAVRFIRGDALAVLRTLPDASVHCCITSPPYMGLRDYGTGTWEGGDDPACGHVKTRYEPQSFVDGQGNGPNSCQSWKGGERNKTVPYGAVCGKCGARRIDQQIGMEPDPASYIAALVAVFREVRRVLRNDGVMFCNMGDAYCAGTSAKRNAPRTPVDVGGWKDSEIDGGARINFPGLPAKNLMMMPARVALALQSDGWVLRSDIIWAKPNPMPESTRDRPTSAHEHIFMFAKQPRYFFDGEAVREAAETADMRRPFAPGQVDARGNGHDRRAANPMRKIKIPGGWDLGVGGHGTIHRDGRTSAEYQDAEVRAGRNIRNVWTIATEPFPSAHFATFPTELAARCIKMATSERGCCAACGAPWGRVVERQTVRQLADVQGTWAERPSAIGYSVAAMTTQRRDKTSGLSASNSHNANTPQSPHVTTTGWRPSCTCSDAGAPVPCTVLDCFSGAGTTALVSHRLGRDAIGIELSADYIALAEDRLRSDAGMFADLDGDGDGADDPADVPGQAIADLFSMAAD